MDKLEATNTREGQKVFATIFFLFTWVHLYKGGSVYIKYEPLSFMPCIMDSVLHAWLHYDISIKIMHFGHYQLSQIGGKFELRENHVVAF